MKWKLIFGFCWTCFAKYTFLPYKLYSIHFFTYLLHIQQLSIERVLIQESPLEFVFMICQCKHEHYIHIRCPYILYCKQKVCLNRLGSKGTDGN